MLPSLRQVFGVYGTLTFIFIFLFSTLIQAQLTADITCDPVKDDEFFSPDGQPLLSYIELDLGTKDVPSPQLDPYHVNIRSPLFCNYSLGVSREQTGCPIMVFHVGIVDTVNGQLEEFRYKAMLDQIAKHGIIVLSLDSALSGSQSMKKYPGQLDPTFNFIYSGALETTLRDNGFVGKINSEKLVFASHGVGARVLLERLSSSKCEHGRMGGIVLLDPVEEPPIEFNLGSLGRIIPDHRLSNVPWITPALHVMTGLGNVVRPPEQSSCCPDATSNNRFYNKWRGPIFQSNAVDVGHLECMNLQVNFNEKSDCMNQDVFVNNGVIFGNYRKCYAEAVAAHILHFVNFIWNTNSVSMQFLVPKLPEDVKEKLNEVNFKRRFKNIEDLGRAFPQTDPFCEFDPDLLDPLTRIILAAMAVLVGIITIVIGLLCVQKLRAVRRKGEEAEKLAESMQHYSIVPGMGYVKAKNLVDMQSVQSMRTEMFPDQGKAPSLAATNEVNSVFPDDYEETRNSKTANRMFVQSGNSNDFPQVDQEEADQAERDEGGIDDNKSESPEF